MLALYLSQLVPIVIDVFNVAWDAVLEVTRHAFFLCW